MTIRMCILPLMPMITEMTTGRTRTTFTAMTDDPAMLLHQWLSPAFPVGAFAYSHGLETCTARGQITTATELTGWLRDICTRGGLRSDLVLLAAAHRTRDPGPVDDIARALCPGRERLLETVQQGEAFVRTVNAVWPLDLPPLTYPVAVGSAAGRMDLPVDLTARLYAQAFLSNLVSAAIRLIPLGQTAGQQVLAELAPDILQTAHEAIDTPLDMISAASFAADIASMQHETLEPRLFRT